MPSTTGSVSIDRPGITLQSAPGEWAVVASPTNVPNRANVIQIRPGGNYGTIRDVEIVGGFQYGIMFWTWQTAPSHWLIENVVVHDTGSSNIKLGPQYGGVQNVTIRKSEFYNAGARARVYGHGIEAVGAGLVTIQVSGPAGADGGMRDCLWLMTAAHCTATLSVLS